MAEGMSREVWFLRQVEKQKYSEDFVQNITQVNQTLTSLSKYLISMQKGIDDLGRDIFEVIGDFVDELIILFGGGTGLEFGLDGLVPVVQKLIGNIPILADLIEILSGIEDGNVNDVGTFINRLLENIFGGFGNANRVLLELQAKLSEGATFHDTFDRPNSPTLGNGWIQGGNGSELQIIDNAARINGPASYGEGRRYAICPKKADQNDMAVSVGVNNKGVAQGACTTIILHSNANMTEFVYANLFLARFYIGRGTRSGNNWTFNDWKSSVDQKRLTEGGMVEFTAKNNTYKLSCNGSTLVEHNDTSDFPRDENHRHSGFVQQTTIFVLPAFSWGIVAYTMRSQVVLTPVDEYVGLKTAAAVAELSEEGGVISELSGTVSAVADTVARLVGEQGGEGSNGINYYHNFRGMPQGDTLTMFTHQSPGVIGINNQNLCVPIIGGAVEARMWSQNKLTADDQEISVVIGQASSFDTFTEVHLRVSDNGSVGVSMRIGNGYVAVGKWSAGSTGGPLNSWTQFGDSMGFKHNNGDTFTLRAKGEVYTVLRNYSEIGSRTNTGAATQKGPTFRKYGLLFRQTAGLFTVVPPRISSMSANDYIVPDFRGTGFRMIRSSAAAKPDTNGDQMYLPSNTFDSIVESGGMTDSMITDMTDARVTIPKDGFWHFDAQIAFNSNTGSGGRYTISLFRTKPGEGPARIVRGQDKQGTQVYNADVHASFYCRAGDTVHLGVHTSSGRGIVGGADGSATYFAGFLGSC